MDNSYYNGDNIIRNNNSRKRPLYNNVTEPNRNSKNEQYYAVICKDPSNPLHGVRFTDWSTLYPHQKNGEFFNAIGKNTRNEAEKVFREECVHYKIVNENENDYFSLDDRY